MRSRGSMASVAPILRRELAAVGVRLADDDVARAGVAGDGRRHQPDRAGAARPARPRRGPGRRARCGPRCRTGRRSRRPPRRCPASGARRWSSAARRTRRTRRRGRRRGRSCWRTGGGGRPGSGGSGRRRRGPRRRRGRPGAKSATLLPTSTISPTNSWPTTSGGWIVRAAHGSHDSMWRSVPQMPVLWTRIRTSLMPIVGIGTSRSSRPGPGAGLDQGEHRRRVGLAAMQLGVEVVGRDVVVESSSSSVVLVESSIVVGPVDDRILHRADALDLAADAVARLEEDRRVAEDADAGRRAGRDDVARLEGDRPG